MNGWPARSAASRKPHPKHIHPGRGAFCAPAVFAAGEMRLNGSKGRGGNGSRVWEKREAPRCRGDDYESPTAYFLSIKKVGKER